MDRPRHLRGLLLLFGDRAAQHANRDDEQLVSADFCEFSASIVNKKGNTQGLHVLVFAVVCICGPSLSLHRFVPLRVQGIPFISIRLTHISSLFQLSVISILFCFSLFIVVDLSDLERLLFSMLTILRIIPLHRSNIFIPFTVLF